MIQNVNKGPELSLAATLTSGIPRMDLHISAGGQSKTGTAGVTTTARNNCVLYWGLRTACHPGWTGGGWVAGCTISNSAYGGNQKAGSPCCDSSPAHIPRENLSRICKREMVWMQSVGPEGKGKGVVKDSRPRERSHRTAEWGDWVRLGRSPSQTSLRALACWPAETAHCFVCKSPPSLSSVPTPTSVPV